MRKIILSLLLVIACLQGPRARCQEPVRLKISGTVTDAETHHPIREVSVRAIGDQGEAPATSDTDGIFILHLAPTVKSGEIVRIGFEKSGYQPVDKLVPVSEVPLPVLMRRIKPSVSKSPGKETSEHGQSSPEVDLSLIFVKKDAFALWVKNNSDTTATDAYYYFGLVDLDQTDDKGILEPLKIVGSKPTWIHKKDAVGAFSVIGDLTPPLPTGHRIFGFVGLNCLNCSRRKFYWVYQVIGVGGWYYEIPEKDSTDVNQLFDIAFHLKTDPNYFVSRIPLVARQAIED